jgi:Acyltransferase
VVTVDWAKNRRTKFFMEAMTRAARWPVLLRADALARGGHNPGRLFSPNDVTRYQRKALRQAVELLVQERIVVVFPEGYPNIDPTYTPKTEPEAFLPFKPGFVHILSAAEKRVKQKIPIIPAGLCYTPGKPWVGQLKFGKINYRADFADSKESRGLEQSGE